MRHGEIALKWADENGPGEDGEYTFRLDLGAIRRLQDRTNAGPFELLSRLSRGAWRVDDVRETIRLGLVAGNKVLTDKNQVDDARINRLIREFVDERPLLQSVAIAARILEAALMEPEGDGVPKSEGAKAAVPSVQTDSSLSPSSMDGDQSLDTPSTKSTSYRSGSSEAARLDISPAKAVPNGGTPQAPMISKT